MAAIADSGSGSDTAIARSPAKGAGGLAGETRWVEDALRGAEDLKQTVTAAAESAFQAAGSSAEDLKRSVTAAADSAFQSVGSVLSRIVSDSSESLEEAKVKIAWAKDHYAAAEEVALAKMKDGIVDAALHPALSCGIAAGLGLVLLKGPRRFLIRNTRRIFVSEESMLSSAQVKVKELQQSVNLVTNESKKLEDRATRAVEDMKRGQKRLIEEGHQIQNQLNFAAGIERQIMSLKGRLNELPKADASRYQSQVSTISSQIKQEKKALNGALSRIINHGIPM
ncbi:RGS1-HXK1-interacting protein 1-like [Musa acuminata AAA Group]|uniref:RGS1-HXK1-interacting protein 1-like n=1 Tax=Musa acuminata AAA Group TaxID=214697 RepID=UPI0031D2B4A7